MAGLRGQTVMDSQIAVGAPIASAVYLVEAPLDGTLELSSVGYWKTRGRIKRFSCSGDR